jgi:sulfopyruvate decarboxylase TPP-binding subunit
MIKAINFWDYLCNTLDYRFFSGIPCTGLNPLYTKMDSKFMHYIPATTNQIAIGLANGSFLAGKKSAILLDSNQLPALDLNFSFNNSIPLLIITSGKEIPIFEKEIYILSLTNSLEECLDNISKYIEINLKPGILFIEEGILQ